ncbi:hypothetical protein K5E40_22050 [Pseudomonas baetica]|uniref:hypothetical protein n=1 Tax=Pseudomonas TaxID=286 RepID=UPI001C8C99FE|nr:hypothetical protein [Pseudomonas baetica]MBX9408367.1 hypothetical protein [Pseudomonas baetica]
MHNYLLQYRFNDEPRTHLFQLKPPQLAEHEAAMHLLELHLGDAENGLVMPTADSTPQEIIAQAERVGITRIEIITPIDN